MEKKFTKDRLSVVMSTYEHEKACNLKDSIESILSQTLQPSEFIIVGDGFIPQDQLKVINDSIKKSNNLIRFIQIKTNVGRGRARNVGIEASTGDYIAIMDSDDIAMPNRLTEQYSYILKNKNIDLVASLTEEFEESEKEKKTSIIKSCPESHSQIVDALAFTNCVANPAILLRKDFWSKVGGFPDFKDINEDYLFFWRLISAGAKFACIQKVLLLVRVGATQRDRRKGLRVLKSDFRFRIQAYREGHISLFWTILPLFIISIRRVSPSLVDNHIRILWRKIALNLYK